MTTTLPDGLLARLSDFVAARTALYFPRERWADLERGLRAAAQESGVEELAAWAGSLMSTEPSRRQIEMLASHLTVGETYFFRERRTFELLEQQILPEMVRSRGGRAPGLRLWSAGCCTGEEPYSMAIAARRALPALTSYPAAVMATDINVRFLNQAATGIYGPWSFREAPAWLKEQYFTPTSDGRSKIAAPVGSMATFAYLNLAEDSYPALWNSTNGMDVIFCRNVLMYFSPAAAHRVVENLARCLVEGGWLVVSPGEVAHVRQPLLASADLAGAVFRRQRSARSLPVTLPEWPIGSASVAMHLASWESSDPGGQERGHSAESPGARGCELPGAGSARESMAESSEASSETPAPEPGHEVSIPAAGLRPEEEAPPGGDTRGLFAEALKLHKQGWCDEAVAHLRQVLRREPSSLPALILLARALADQGRLSEALVWCDRAIEADKLSATAHYLRATILQEQGALDQAGVALGRVLYLEPGFVLARFTLGNLALHQGKRELADRHFERALGLLASYEPTEVLAESNGVTAGRLAEIIGATRESEAVV